MTSSVKSITTLSLNGLLVHLYLNTLPLFFLFLDKGERGSLQSSFAKKFNMYPQFTLIFFVLFIYIHLKLLNIIVSLFSQANQLFTQF